MHQKGTDLDSHLDSDDDLFLLNNKNINTRKRSHTIFKSYLSILNTHKKSHSEEKPFACKECSKGCTTIYALEVHMRKHRDERPFKCHLCEKRFKANSILKNHVQIHSGERPFKSIKKYIIGVRNEAGKKLHGSIIKCTECSKHLPSRHILKDT